MTSFAESKYLKDLCDITFSSYEHGWDERNGGNVSIRLTEDDLKDFDDISEMKREYELGFDASAVSGQYFLVTGSGRYFRNVIRRPNLDAGLVRISDDGSRAELFWGFEDGARPTSEFPTHLMSHIERLKADSSQRVVMHCHPTNFIALSFTQELDERNISRLLWKIQAESLVEEYQKSDEKLEEFAIRHGLRGRTQLSQWIMGYNESILEDCRSGKRDSGMKGGKTTFDERLEIIEQLIRHDVDYNWAAEHYNVSYNQVYGWYRKYTGSGNDPESLRDRRGKVKPESELTELDRLKRENKLLKARLHQQEMEMTFPRKLVETHDMEMKRDPVRKLNEEYN